MQKTFIGILILMLVIALFVLRNAHPVYIDFGFWGWNVKLSVVLITTLFFGAIASYLLAVPINIKHKKTIKEQKKKIAILKSQLLKYQTTTGLKEDEPEKTKVPTNN